MVNKYILFRKLQQIFIRIIIIVLIIGVLILIKSIFFSSAQNVDPGQGQDQDQNYGAIALISTISLLIVSFLFYRIYINLKPKKQTNKKIMIIIIGSIVSIISLYSLF